MFFRAVFYNYFSSFYGVLFSSKVVKHKLLCDFYNFIFDNSNLCLMFTDIHLAFLVALFVIYFDICFPYRTIFGTCDIIALSHVLRMFNVKSSCPSSNNK